MDDDIQIAFLYHPVVPHRLNQFVLSDEVSTLLNEQGQRLKRFRGQRHDLIAAEERVFRRVETERAEFVSLLNFRKHLTVCKKNLRLIRSLLMPLQSFSKDCCGRAR